MLVCVCMYQRQRQRAGRDIGGLDFRAHWWRQVGDMHVCLYQELMETGWGGFSALY